jgi:hypothetical protein
MMLQEVPAIAEESYDDVRIRRVGGENAEKYGAG